MTKVTVHIELPNKKYDDEEIAIIEFNQGALMGHALSNGVTVDVTFVNACVDAGKAVVGAEVHVILRNNNARTANKNQRADRVEPVETTSSLGHGALVKVFHLGKIMNS